MNANLRPYTQKTFIAAAVVLALAAMGLNGAVMKMQLFFKKLPVPPARALTEIAPRLGTWIQISRDEPLQMDMQEVLGTDRYIFRDYLDITAHGGRCAADLIQGLYVDDKNPSAGGDAASRFIEADASQQADILNNELKNRTNDERKGALAVVQRQFPDAVVNMAVTYYTGLADTVAHIPDRCYIADGFEPTDYTVPTWTLSSGRQFEVRFINFQDAGDTARPNRSVAYFFNVNGRYESDPLAVRRSLQNLFNKYGYYAKVELMTMDSDEDRSAQTMTGFLDSALGEVEKTWPDWKKVTGEGAK